VLEMLTGWVASARPTLSATGAVRRPLALMLAIATVMLSACSDEGAPMQTVDNVDLDRFMGDWYVVAGIVTSMEQDAYNPVETLRAGRTEEDRDDVHVPRRQFRRQGENLPSEGIHSQH
jgi:lipocalin